MPTQKGNKLALKHGMFRTPEHNAWQNMKSRCHNELHPRFKDWGAKGIYVCDEWRQNFMAFYNYLGPRPSTQHSVDRIDGSRGYEPGNVRWATRSEQSENRPSFIRHISFNGKTQSISAWAREVGINRECLKYRLDAGWDIEAALMTKSRLCR